MRGTAAKILSLASVLAVSACAPATNIPTTAEETTVTVPTSPPPTRIDTVVDTLHGTPVADPYRWLEDDSEEVRAWTDRQNAYTDAVLGAVPGREHIAARLDTLLQIGFLTTPEVAGEARFYEKRDGEQNHPVLYVRWGDATPVALFDPNEAEDITTALDWHYPTRDGSLLAYGVSVSGSEQSTLHVVNARTGEVFEDSIPRTRGCSVAWLNDNSGFYYTRYPEVGTVPKDDEAYFRHVYFHKLGTSWRDDPLVYGEGKAKTNWPVVSVSTNDQWAIVTDWVTFSQSDVYALDRTTGEWHTVVEGVDAKFMGMAVEDTLYAMTNLDAPRFRIVATTLGPSPTEWREIVPQRESIIEDYALAADRIVVNSLTNATTNLEVFDYAGNPVGDIELPSIGSVSGVSADPASSVIGYAFSSYFYPPASFEYDLSNGTSTEFDRIQSNIDPSAYRTEQVWYESKDGTRVSMFVVSRADVTRNGANPTLLYGYGGFSSNMTPVFQRNTFLWLEQGGVYAVPNLRGGGEYGEEWHEAGMLGTKQNTYDDFIAAAEWLIAEGYTSPERLAIMGGSNGGLLTGAVLTQRPDLFAAAVSAVPLLDMLRYQDFLIGSLWIPEYGDPNDPEQFQWLYAYSPYHHVASGTAYPAVLLTAADSDSRVHPMHARKMAARLQATTTSGRPILLRIETKAGHGQGKPRSKIVEEYTDIWSFISSQLGLTISE